MARAQYVGVCEDNAGNKQSNVPVAVNLHGAGSATIYPTEVGATPLSSLISDITGTFTFWADPAVTYDILPAGYPSRTVSLGGTAGPPGPPGTGANWRGAWSNATTYALSDGVASGSPLRNYVSLSAGNLNHLPTPGGDAYWTDLSATSSPGAFTVGGQLVMPAHGTLESIIDGIDFTRDGRSMYRRLMQLSTSSNGSNGTRGDSIASATANSDGSFAISDYTILQHDTKGSMQGPTVVGTINEVGGGGVYGEMGLYEAVLTINRQGAYGTPFESEVIVNSGKQARAAGHVVLVSEANALSSYTMLDSIWNDTGSRGQWIASVGANPAGTGIFVQGDFARAALYVQFSNQANYVLYSKGAGSTSPLVAMNGLGTVMWGSGSAQDVTLARAGAGLLLAGNPGAGVAAVGVNPSVAGNQAVLNLYDASTLKWQIGKQTDNSLFLFDVAGGTVPFRADTGNKLGFFGGGAVARPVLSYSRSGAGETSAGAFLRSALATLGLVTDSTTT